MEDPLEQHTLSPGVKRTHDGQPVFPTNLTMQPIPAQHEQLHVLRRSQSPALSTTSSSLTDLSSSAPQDPTPGAVGSPTKKRKLTFAEKQVKQAEEQRQKEEKAKLKAKEKARKEDEKRLKDEEKRKKAEEREAAKRVKEVEKAEKEAARAEKQKMKDAEKAKKEAETLKKERAQMRLGAFFGRPAPASTPPSTPEDVSSGVSSRRSSIASLDMERPELDVKATKSHNPEYSSWILPFFPHEHTDIAPYNRFLKTCGPTGLGIPGLDPSEQAPNPVLEPITRRFGPPKPRKVRVVPVKTIIDKMIGSEAKPIDLTGGSEADSVDDVLRHTSYKILSFREDIRPPYQGTFTRIISARAARKLSRNPTHRGMPKIDYDYDSEAEWEAPDAGDEDLEDEDEMSDEEDPADEMADFLDDEEEIARRRVTAADVEPTCTGICWEGEAGSIITGIDLTQYRMDVLHDETRLPINPYSTDHWAQLNKTSPGKGKGQAANVDASTTPSMQPPRLPLATVKSPNGSPLKKYVTTNSNTGASSGQKENEAPGGQQKQARNPKKPTKTIPTDLIPSFKAAVSGSDLNKVALIEILKKQFPKCSKDAIKGTLETIAVRQGVKEADKRWVLIA